MQRLISAEGFAFACTFPSGPTNAKPRTGALVWLPGHHYRRADCARVTPAGGEHKSLLSHALTRHAYAIGREIRPEAQQPATTGRGARRLLELPRAPESGSSRGR
jgi:hypothetical protein